MKRPKQYFRAGVGAVILDKRGWVLVGERRGTPGAWQFPQGGIEDAEEPKDAVFREIEEETRIPKSELKLLERYPDLLAYELPREARSAKTGLGQVQFWFFLRYKGRTPLELHPSKGEFTTLTWVPMDRAVSRVVGFKKPVYRKLTEHFRSKIRARLSRGG